MKLTHKTHDKAHKSVHSGTNCGGKCTKTETKCFKLFKNSSAGELCRLYYKETEGKRERQWEREGEGGSEV